MDTPEAMDHPDTPAAIAAWVGADRRQELSTMRAQLSPAVRLVSPLTDGFTFDGPDRVMAVFESAFELLRDIEIHKLTGRHADWVLYGKNTFRGDNLEEIQWLHLDDAGLIDHITLFIRPAPAAIALLARIGAPLARRGALKAAAGPASRAALPLAAILRLVERRTMPGLGLRD